MPAYKFESLTSILKKIQIPLSVSWTLLGIIFVLFPFVTPTSEGISVLFGVSIGSKIATLLKYYRYFSYIIILVYFFLRLYKNEKNNFLPGASAFIVFLLCSALLVSTLHSNTSELKNNLITISGILFLFLFSSCFPGNAFLIFIRAGYIWLTGTMLLNSCCMYIYYPNGMYQSGFMDTNKNYYLYGLDNVCFMYSLAGCSLGLIYRFAKGRISTSLICSYAFIFGAYYYTKAGTAMAIITILAFFVLILSFYNLPIINYTLTLIISCISFFSICLLNTLGVFNGALALIGKDATFTHRTEIWAAVFASIKNHLLFGFGLSDSVMHLELGMATRSAYMANIGHVHNVVLEFLFRGGLLAVAIFVLFLFYPIKSMSQNKTTKIAQLLCGLFLLLWLTCMFEFRLGTLTFWLLPICIYNIDTLVSIAKKEKSKYA